MNIYIYIYIHTHIDTCIAYAYTRACASLETVSARGRRRMRPAGIEMTGWHRPLEQRYSMCQCQLSTFNHKNIRPNASLLSSDDGGLAPSSRGCIDNFNTYQINKFKYCGISPLLTTTQSPSLTKTLTLMCPRLRALLWIFSSPPVVRPVDDVGGKRLHSKSPHNIQLAPSVHHFI
jgi:hypothetical protein